MKEERGVDGVCNDGGVAYLKISNELIVSLTNLKKSIT